MITIQERQSKKSVGKTSLFITFNYNPKIVEIVKMADNAIWDKNNKEWELPCSKLSYLIDELTIFDDIQLNLLKDNKSQELVQTIKHKVPAFDYQSEGIDWLINRSSGLLLDPPGLGKTLQIIYAAEELKKQKGVEHCLIICGINTLKQNWKKEIEKFSTESCRIIGEKINSKGKITYATVKERAEELFQNLDDFFIIINIESLRDNLVIDAILNSQNNFDMIVVDELHKCKQPNTQQGKNLLKLTKVGKYHFGLTGTVLINSPIDSYVPLKFIGYEKSNYSNFKAFYCVISQKFGHYQIDGYKNLDLLKEEINSCSIRRDKSILNLPPKVIIPEYIEMDATQEKFYNDIHAGIVVEADRVNIKNTSLLGLVTRLRQAATCPSVLTTSNIKNTKLDRCVDLVDEIVSNNEKVVIFSTFKEPLYNLYNELNKYKPFLCTGDQTEEEISHNIDAFQEDDEHMVMLCTTSKLGTGVTLHRASYEIFLDSTWTASLEEQCEERCYRIGTNKSVTVFKLIAKNTIDERIQTILTRKRAISDYIIDNKVTSEVEELKELLGI